MKKKVGSQTLANFASELVRITTRLMVELSADTEEGQVLLQKGPVQHEGFFIDQDDMYYYLSQNNKHISHAIKIDDVHSIESIDSTMSTELLDNLNVPNKDKMN